MNKFSKSFFFVTYTVSAFKTYFRLSYFFINLMVARRGINRNYLLGNVLLLVYPFNNGIKTGHAFNLMSDLQVKDPCTDKEIQQWNEILASNK